jgi:hypothetical protein
MLLGLAFLSYLDATSELNADLKKIKYYQYGPRTLMEVTKVQILNFVCKVRCIRVLFST